MPSVSNAPQQYTVTFGDVSYGVSVTTATQYTVTVGLGTNSSQQGISGLGVWRYRTETSAPPNTGQIRFDNANPELATEFYLHETNDDGIDTANILDLLLLEGSVMFLQDAGNASNYIVVEAGTIVDNGTYRTVQITQVFESGSAPNQNAKGIILVAGSSSAAGNVNGPGGATDNAIARFDATTGKLIQNSGVIIDDSNNMSGMGTVDGRDVAADGTKLDGVEALADVTDAANVAAAGAMMDRSKTFTVENPEDLDDLTVFFTDRAITVTEIQVVRTGGTDIDWTLYHGTTAHATTNTLVAVTSTSDSGGDTITSFTDETIPADSFITYVQGTTGGTPTEISLTIFYTED